jgi:hypothetical protein
MKKRKPALPAGEVGTNIVEAEQSFNRKVTVVRVQRKQVVFTTVMPFIGQEDRVVFLNEEVR